jgi:hypothetical protein
MDHKIKLSLKAALEKVAGTYNRKELYRILKVAENLGLEWGCRNMYGGGNEVLIDDNEDNVASIIINNKTIIVAANENYFKEGFVPSYRQYYSEEQLAEIRNEEALYGYEMPHFKIIRSY